ncbi:hypothetical protein EX30DRAFT_397083 [Ascodesmis nigricans]|uniref:Uncharacterized protein n=1 Tax=Ascodesmis nigricans TaxID=341454 RepID=A0A4S2MQI9_9PEZI|nr:hypothetical protein EX30DRAFT_397083 [Ascodesmis nigricans]
MKVSAVVLVAFSALAAAQTGTLRPTGGLAPSNGTSTLKPTSSGVKTPSPPSATPSDKDEDKSAAGVNAANSVAALVLAAENNMNGHLKEYDVF